MNTTVASLTARSLLGRKRTLVLLLLPVALLALCTLARVLAGLDPKIARELDGPLAPDLLTAFGIAILMPLLSLIAGTGSIGPEIDEGSIVYLLVKPLSRYSIVVTKLTVAAAVVVLFGVLPIAVAGVVLAATYLALNPPSVEPGAATARPVARRYEWLAPVLLVDAVFLVFLGAQATVIFGGHGYLERTTGLTYAEYVHEGFGQLTVATALTLLVVWAAARKAPRRTAADLAWLRGSLGLLCVLTLVVVASALYRMHVYQEAYGFTRLRLLVDVFEGWLGLLVLGVMAAGLTLRAAWLPRAALLSGAGLLLLLAAVNPDAWVAQHNLDRYAETGKVDWAYLQDLSADAVPVLATLPDAVAECALTGHEPSDDDWLEWNLGRHRAAPLMRANLADWEYNEALCARGAAG